MIPRRNAEPAGARKREMVVVPPDRHARLRAMVEDHLDFVTRALRNAGVPRADLDDEVQRTFIVAARRLDDVQLGAERSFLFQVAHNLASHARRRIARRREVLDESPPERVEALATPEFLTDRKQMRCLLDDVIGSLHESLGAVFRLFEFEEMNLSEIAETLDLPRGTVASRLRRARAQLREHVAASELAPYLGANGGAQVREPSLLRRERVSTLQRALLVVGTAARASASAHAKTLAALGFS